MDLPHTRDRGIFIGLGFGGREAESPPELFCKTEYYTLAAQGFTWSEPWALNHATLDASFLDEFERRELRMHWDKFEQSHLLKEP